MLTLELTIHRLIDLGYLKYVPPADAGRVREELIAGIKHGYLMSGWAENAHRSEDWRTYSADSECLMEAGVGEKILEMKQLLEKEGVYIVSVDDNMSDDYERYSVSVNGREYPIFDENQYRHGLLRGISTRRLLEIVNGFLGEAGSPERLYWIDGGDDGRVILLTEPMYELLSTPGLGMDPREMPRPSAAIGDDGSALWYWSKDGDGSLRRWDSDRGFFD